MSRPDPGQGPGRFVLDSVRMGWRWLTRMKTALLLLGLLALETLLATVVPQEPNVPGTVAEWRAGTEGPGTAVSAVIDALGGYDVYGSPAFLLLLTLLFTSLTACLIPRWRAQWRLIRRGRPPRVRAVGRQPLTAVLTTAAPPDQAHATAADLLRRRRWRLRPDGNDGDRDGPASPQVAAERGLVARELGSLVFHTSFYVLLVGVVAGQLFGFEGQVGVVEGEAFTDAPVAYWSRQPGRLWDDDDHRRFTLALDEFDVDWHRDPAFGGQPKVFSSDVTVTRADGSVLDDTVGGNDPLIVDGMRIHQLDWGYAPRIVVEVDGEVVHDRFLVAEGLDDGSWHAVAKAPAADPDVALDLLLWPYAPERDGRPVPTGAPWADAPLVAAVEYRGDLRLDRAQNVNRLDTEGLEPAGGAALRPGTSVTLDDGVVVRFPELRRWVGFQVSDKPTLPLLFVGGVLVLAGLVPSLYAYRRRLWVEATAADGGRTLVVVGGRAFQREQAFEDEFGKIVGELREALEAGEAPGDRPDDRRETDPTQVVTG